jgi:hypothetical protein
VGTVEPFPEQDGQTMPRASRCHSRAPGLAIRVAGLAAVLAGAIAACSTPAATPLYSLVIDSTPTPPAGEQARRAFIDRVVAGDLTYHATFDGLVYGAAGDLAVAGSLDVAGADYQLVATYTFADDPIKTSFAIRYVGGTAWVRINGGKWTEDSAYRAAQTNSPFAFVTGDPNVTFAKTETVSGQTFHHVTIDRSHLIGLAQIQAGNLTNEELKRTSFALVLDDDGAPVSGTSRIEGVARVSGQLQEIIVQLDLVFSKVGADMVINAP